MIQKGHRGYRLGFPAAVPGEEEMNEINISRLVDTARLRPFHFWLIAWCLLAMMADGFDLLNASPVDTISHSPPGRKLLSSCILRGGK